MLQQFNRGEIWLATDKENKNGSVQTMFNRPVVILQNNMGNRFSPTITILPLTSQRNKKWLPTHVTLYKTKNLNSLSTVLVEQITTISKEKLTRFIGSVDLSEMLDIENAVLIQCGISPRNNIAYA